MAIERYSDIDTLFTAHPVSKDVVAKTNIASIKQALRNLLNTNRYERFYRPGFGADIRALLFEQASPLTSKVLSDVIRTAIENYEPRVEIINLYVSELPDLNSYAVTLLFAITKTGENGKLEINLERIR